jgi:hypothetical protein
VLTDAMRRLPVVGDPVVNHADFVLARWLRPSRVMNQLLTDIHKLHASACIRPQAGTITAQDQEHIHRISTIELLSYLMQNLIQKRSVVIAGHRTSVSQAAVLACAEGYRRQTSSSINRLVGDRLATRRQSVSAIRVILESASQPTRARAASG